MSTFTFDHLHLRSPDPVKTAQFYIDMLGATMTGQVETPNGIRMLLKLGGLTTFIEQIPPTTAQAPASAFIGMDHIGLLVQDIHATVAELKAKGCHFSMEIRTPRPGTTIAFVDAPDGVRVELLERKPM